MANCISGCGANLMYTAGVGWSGDSAYGLQLVGTHECLIFEISVNNNDAYNFSIGTCLSDNPPPPCALCGVDESYEYLTLTNASGSGTGATADVMLGGVQYGDAEVLFSNLSINEDLSGSQFGAVANGSAMEETFILQINLCEAIDIQQVDILGLETDSEVWVGTGISGTGSAAVPTGPDLVFCGGSNTMNSPTGNMVINNAGGGCNNQGNGNYTVGGVSTSVLYFKYNNPMGGCSFDKATFRIGACVPDDVDVVPTCPLTQVTLTDDFAAYETAVAGGGSGAAQSYVVTRDANGIYFNQDCSQIQNEVDNMTAITPAAISPCAEIVDEEDCAYCDPPPPCTACPAGSEYSLISLSGGSDNDGDGLDEGEIFLNGVCIGAFDVVFSDLDLREDVSGTTFGGADGDGGVYLLELDFCEPQTINQLDIRGLEVMSQVSVGTSFTGTPAAGAPATLAGLDLTHCDGSLRMLPEDPPVNQVITDGPGCLANPNASYEIGATSVSTLYFQYHNPPGGCTRDYVGFRLGICYEPPPMATPICPVEVVTVTCDTDQVIADGGANAANSDQYVLDGAGNYFDFQSCTAMALQDAVENATALQTIDIGCAELVQTDANCDYDCTIPPTCVATDCPAGATFEYINLNQTGSNGAGNPMGDVLLDGLNIGTYDFVFSDLDISEDGNGTKFGGWDNDGGTMLLAITFCEATTIQELDILGLEVGSQVTVGTAASTMDAAAVLSGLTLTNCNDPSGRMAVGPGANEVITDGPGCLANPNATYTITPQAVTTLYFKYHNPPQSSGYPGTCRGDYVGFRLGACVPAAPMDVVLDCDVHDLWTTMVPDGTLGMDSKIMDITTGVVYNLSDCSELPVVAVEVCVVSPCFTPVAIEMCPACLENIIGIVNPYDPDNPTDPTASDPCSCIDGTQTANGAADGRFADILRVMAASGLNLCADLSTSAGSVWTSGGMLLTTTSTPSIDCVPFTESAITAGLYELNIQHLDRTGFVMSGVFVDMAGSQGAELLTVAGGSLVLGNTCYYPIIEWPQIDPICSKVSSVNLKKAIGASLTDQSILDGYTDADGTFEYFVDGSAVALPGCILDVTSLSKGDHTITVVFTPNEMQGVSVDTDDPSCGTEIEQTFSVRVVECGTFPWNGN